MKRGFDWQGTVYTDSEMSSRNKYLCADFFFFFQGCLFQMVAEEEKSIKESIS